MIFIIAVGCLTPILPIAIYLSCGFVFTKFYDLVSGTKSKYDDYDFLIVVSFVWFGPYEVFLRVIKGYPLSEVI